MIRGRGQMRELLFFCSVNWLLLVFQNSVNSFK